MLFIKIFYSLHAQILIHGNNRKIATAVLTVEPLIPAASLQRGPLMSLQSGSKKSYSNLNKKTRKKHLSEPEIFFRTCLKSAQMVSLIITLVDQSTKWTIPIRFPVSQQRKQEIKARSARQIWASSVWQLTVFQFSTPTTEAAVMQVEKIFLIYNLSLIQILRSLRIYRAWPVLCASCKFWQLSLPCS